MIEPRYSGLNSHLPYVQLFVSLFVTLLVSLIMLSVSLLLGKLIFGNTAFDIKAVGEALSGKQLALLKFTQSLQHISMFLVPSIVVAYILSRKPGHYFGIKICPGGVPILFVVVLAIVITPLTGHLGIWNAKMQLPGWMSGIESWMRGKEGEAATITGWLIRSDNIPTLLINILILSVLPAFGEEMLFRGILQKLFAKVLKSGHLAIILTAILFSASHLQFFGFLPRLLLGLIFGYLYYWSRSIWLSVLAHFINNLIPVVLAYFIGWESINLNVEEVFTRGEYVILVPIFFSGLLLFGIWDQLKKSNSYEEKSPE